VPGGAPHGFRFYLFYYGLVPPPGTAEGGCPHVTCRSYTRSSTFNGMAPPFQDPWNLFCTKAAS
jgi:hypothetical protein